MRICTPMGMDGGAQSPLSSDSQRSSIFHHPAEPRTHKGAGVSDRVSWGPACRPGAGAEPQHLGERNSGQPLPETTSACMEGETKSVSSGQGQGQDHGRLCSRLCSAFGFFFKCRFFVTEKVSLPLKRSPGQQGPAGYVGQSKNPEKEEWMYSVE